MLGDRQGQVARGLHELDPVELSRLRRVAKVGEDTNALGLDEQRRVRARHPGQPADIDRRRDEQRLLELRAQAVQAHGHRRSASHDSASR
jgi:hypothetical protein